MIMKKITGIIAALALLICLAACGETAPAAPDMGGLFRQMTALEGMPEMLEVPPEKAVNFYGIAPEDCVQELTAVCRDSLRADELWLIEAVDEAAAERIAALAQARLEQKGSELESYSPEQYAVVQSAELIRSGNCVVLIVSPMADELAELVASA